MAIVDRYRYVADAISQSGDPLGQLHLAPDWEPAVQCAYFRAVRKGKAPPLMRCTAARVEPIWDSESGAPLVEAVRISFDDGDGPSLSYEVPKSYLRPAVEKGAAVLVEQGKLEAGDRFLFELNAFPRQPDAEADRSHDRGFTVEEIVRPLPLVEASLEASIQDAERVNGHAWSDGDMPLFIPERVIVEAVQLAREAGDVESGGVLIGRLCRDEDSDEVFSVVTAFIPAPHAVAERARLTFTADTWAAVRAAVELRRQDEMLLGWAHSHPFWCKSCPEERRRDCALLRPFFSADDVALHRTVFPGPYHTAVLLSDLGEADFAVDAFGWRHGLVVPRGYYLTGASEVASEQAESGALQPALVDEDGGADRSAACEAKPEQVRQNVQQAVR
jgi:hypothetical protein